jgi:hypothetical protein
MKNQGLLNTLIVTMLVTGSCKKENMKDPTSGASGTCRASPHQQATTGLMHIMVPHRVYTIYRRIVVVRLSGPIQ